MAAALIGLHLTVRAVEHEYVHALAPVEVHVKPFGLSLNEEALRHDDLLPAYGASELLFPSPHDAYEIFKYYQSGFQVYSVAAPGTTPIILLQRLGALGPHLRGRKVVVTITPPTFFRPPLDQDSYIGNYSTIAATALTFDPSIPYELRQAVARRLLQYPATLQDNAPLRWALEALASPSWTGRIGYAMLFPLGKLCEAVLRLQDEWLTLTATEKPGTPSPAHAELSRPIDWDLLARQAANTSRQSSRNNPYGFGGSYWREHTHQKVQREGDPGLVVKWMAAGLRHEHRTQEWEDLDLLLRILVSLGAQPLILSEPFPGRYLDTWGVTPADRAWYYAQIRQLAARRGVALVDFEDHDEDETFNQDPNGHLSDTGWVLMAHAFDDFYHGVRRPGGPRSVATSGTTNGTSTTVP
jgi:D-alanine transfer protein